MSSLRKHFRPSFEWNKKSFKFAVQTVVVAQLVRAPDCGSGGRRFETDLPPQKLQGIAEMQSLFYIKSAHKSAPQNSSVIVLNY